VPTSLTGCQGDTPQPQACESRCHRP
jgi:hypothetical protein